MASEMPPSRRYRRLRKAFDVSAVTAASPHKPKRMRTSKKSTTYEDRISSLPEEILLMILDKLDTRSTITTTILSKRWRDLPRHLPTSYNLAVDDFLSPRYHRLKRLNMEAKAGYEAEKNMHKLNDIYAIKARHERWMAKIRPLSAILERYERRAMRRYVKQVNAFLLAPNNVCQPRPVHKLRLQMLGLGRLHENIEEWVTAAIAKWGVEDFELIIDGYGVYYDLKQLDRYQNVRLERLVLFNCQPMCAWNCLTVQRLTKLTLGANSYMGIISSILTNCIELRDFRITSSRVCQDALRFFVPTSKIQSLQVDWCCFRKIYLMSLPCLETFVCRGRPTKLFYGEVPRLRHVSLDYIQTEDNDIDDESGTNRTYPPSKFFKRIPPLDSLVLQFKGPRMWIEPFVVSGGQLKMLFIANVPVKWDVIWILLLLGASPALESFHVHIDNNSEQRSSGDLCDSLDFNAQQHQNLHLKELVVAGFEGWGWQTGFVRLIMKRSPLLRHVHLLDGEVRDDEQELGALQIVPRRREWHECERAEVLDDLIAGFRFPPRIILE